jgi:polyisoprenoid-binding protein YceI
MRVLAAILTTVLLALPAGAETLAYRLDATASVVGFSVRFAGGPITGQMPVTRADLTLDFDRVANCRIDVTLDASRAQASFPFAAQAMKAADVLDTGRHPAIRFASTRVRADGAGAVVDGNLTIRGVTRPVRLAAQLYRQKGTAEGDRSRLSIRLTGSVSRAAFGATGWADLVGDTVAIDILARIARAE